ncbi:hypothetical protein P152DRAFT_390289 [Eremomyces bilateralis CBS 781.70]|uniref:Glutathione S-transferase n=1 Tax=Eremomyces bilateralis CBS 781.70 TaxID=1392243 RepID=A0A6G1GC68_9PEZI|nr:uncharacterized protein P152DRAFT_390289 [Eremomyces bilateralis CBS 781.70]KAF1815582.1 hypothetical protein P152DRAFT_390289 [Eremomyces bilateralis CBS 781.70]
MSKLILYDLPTKEPRRCWTYNPWKTRLVLNYKGIDYETEWTAYPDIEGKFKSFGIPPGESGTPYTIPAIKVGDHYVMDSKSIAHELEALHPSPPLYLDDLVLAEVETAFRGVWGPLYQGIIPKVPRRLLPERDKEYFVRTREETLGAPLEELEKTKGGEGAWKEAEPAIREWAEILKREVGPFVKGKTVSYADFVIVSFLQFVKTIGDDVFDKFVGYDQTFKDIYEASADWVKRDDH